MTMAVRASLVRVAFQGETKDDASSSNHDLAPRLAASKEQPHLTTVDDATRMPSVSI